MNCHCPMCRRSPVKLRKMSELDSPPLTEDSRKKLDAIVASAYSEMAKRFASSAGEKA